MREAASRLASAGHLTRQVSRARLALGRVRLVENSAGAWQRQLAMLLCRGYAVLARPGFLKYWAARTFADGKGPYQRNQPLDCTDNEAARFASGTHFSTAVCTALVHRLYRCADGPAA